MKRCRRKQEPKHKKKKNKKTKQIEHASAADRYTVIRVGSRGMQSSQGA